MRVLVLNCGSSSVKFQLLDLDDRRHDRLARGTLTRVSGGKAHQAIEEALKQIPEPEKIHGVGHRVVHGGDRFRESVVIDEEVVRQIESVSSLAPLHNPHNLEGYYAAKALLPHATHVAVFDTAFHHTIPPKAHVYGIPYEYYERDKIRRYGFHGTSHQYLSLRFREITGDADARLITCHLGNGCSVCAIDAGRSVDTSMGFTPMEGLIMGTRPGDLDPGAVLYLAQREPPQAIDRMLNERSGLLGVSGVSNDMQDLQAAAATGNARAALAIEMFCYRVTKYIGAYFAALGGAAAIIFAGGIGENAPAIREQICRPLAALGIRIDAARNQAASGKEQNISAGGTAVSTWVIPTDEELMIARDTMHAILKSSPH